MSRFPLNIAPGYNGDDTTFRAAGQWKTGSNVRFDDGSAQTIGGWSKLIEDDLEGVCRNGVDWNDTSGALNLALGTNSHLYVILYGELNDITPSGLAAGLTDGYGGPGYGAGPYGEDGYGEATTGDFFPRTWSLFPYGQTLIASPRNGGLYQWTNDVDVVAAAVTDAPTRNTAMVVTPNRQVHVFGTTTVATDGDPSPTFEPMLVRGSDLGNIEEWSPAPENNSYERTLQGGGRLVGARLSGPDILLWSDTTLFLGVDTGTPNEPYQYRAIEGSAGLIGPNAAVVTPQGAYWIGPDRQFYRYVSGVVERLNCPISTATIDYLADAQQDKIIASHTPQFGEVRFDYPDNRDGGENSRYIVLGPDGWYSGVMARSAYFYAGGSQKPLGVNPDGEAFSHEEKDDDQSATANGGAIAWEIESADQYMSEDQQMWLMSLWPDIKAQRGPVQVTVYMRRRPTDAEKVYGPYAIAPGQQKVDIRACGRLMRLKFSGNATPTFFRLGKPILDLRAGPTR